MSALLPQRAILLAAVAAVLALALPVSADAGFSSQMVPVAGPVTGGNSGLSDIAVNGSGEALVAWTEGGTNDVAIRVRRIHPDGSLGPVLEAGGGTTRALGPEVDFAPNGRAILAWIESAKFGDPQSVRARWIEPNDSMTKAITVKVGDATTSEPGELDLATTSDDGAILAWHNFKSKPLFRIVEAKYMTAGSALSEPILPTSGAGSVHVQVAPNSSGGSLMAWRDSSVEVQGFSETGVPGSLKTPGPGIIADPELATDGSDHFQLGYKVGFDPSSIVYHAVSADGSFGPAQDLEPSVPEQLYGLSLATNPGNRTVAAWDRVGEKAQTVRTRFIAPDGTPETTTFSTPAGPGNSASPSAGIGGLGGAAIAWLQSPTPEAYELWGRVFPPGGAPDGPVSLSSGAGVPGVPELAIGAGETGLLAWDERLPTSGPEPSFQIYVRQILPPPSCPDAAGTIVQGRPTMVSLNCTGVQLQAPAIVAQPEHGQLTEIDAATQSALYTPLPGFAGDDNFQFRGTNPGGPGAVRTARMKVGKDTVKPRVKRFTISKRRIPAGASTSAKGRKKTTFRLTYSETARATIAIERARRCGGVAGVSRRCRRFGKLGTLRAKVPGLSAKVKLPKRVGGRRLRPGHYRATAIATDPAGNRSKPKRLTFSVVSG